MFKVGKKDPASKELQDYSDKVKVPLREILLSDQHIDVVSPIIYKHLPKVWKWKFKDEMKFKEFYRSHRQQMVNMMVL